MPRYTDDASSIQGEPDSQYQALCNRISHCINSPRAQRDKTVLLERSPGDADADWSKLLDEIAENDNVTLAHRDDGSVQVFWTVAKDV